MTGDTGHAQPGHREPGGILRWLTTTDHKVIGLSYLVTSFVFFLAAGVLALIMRAELAKPGLQVVGEDRYNQLFTVHGTVMMFFFAAPFVFGLANYLVPLQVGAPDMAFPRLNALSYWLFLGGGLLLFTGFLTPRGAANFGWFAYSPLNNDIHTPHVGADLWIASLTLSGVSGVLGAVNFVTTIVSLRAPGMTMFRMPMFTWNILVVSVLVLLAFPVFTAALFMLYADRNLGARIFDATAEGPILWQHMFWFFGHPEVYIIALPFFGVITEVLPVFSRKPTFGYKGLVFATLAIAAYSVSVWAHHMFTTDAVSLPFFAFLSYLIAVPTGVKFFNWIGTMWGGQISFEAPMLFAIGFLLTFLLGGLSGVVLAAAPLDLHVHDTYFVVAHMHYVLFGAAVFGMFSAIYFWFPKWTGRRLHEGWGGVHFVLLFIGFHATFLIQHVLGADGMPRRLADYPDVGDWATMNLVSSIGSFVLGMSFWPFLWNVYRTLRRGERTPQPDPWGFAQSLEWATPSPPPRANFDRLPPIRSFRPAFDLHHPEGAMVGGRERRASGTGEQTRAGSEERQTDGAGGAGKEG